MWPFPPELWWCSHSILPCCHFGEKPRTQFLSIFLRSWSLCMDSSNHVNVLISWTQKCNYSISGVIGITVLKGSENLGPNFHHTKYSPNFYFPQVIGIWLFCFTELEMKINKFVGSGKIIFSQCHSSLQNAGSWFLSYAAWIQHVFLTPSLVSLCCSSLIHTFRSLNFGSFSAGRRIFPGISLIPLIPFYFSLGFPQILFTFSTFLK